MKKLLTLAGMCLVAIVAVAQNATIKVEYTERYQNWTGANKKEKFILLANNEESRYYNPMTQVVDSMLSTTEGTIQFNSMVEAANAAGQRPSLLPGSRTYIIKSRKTAELKCFEEAAGELGNYTESSGEQNWIVCDSTKTILGYDCLMAEMDYHGRHWIAWFSPEIPAMNGPWKLSGLPGLILEAETADGLYYFIATGLQQTTQPIGPVYLADKYEKVSRKELLKSKRRFIDNPLGNINSQLGGKDATFVIQDENGNPISANQRLFAPREEVDFIETDY